MARMAQICLTFTIFAAVALANQVQAEVGVGDTAPDFSLAGSDGNTHTLAEMRGKYVVVAFFPKAFTKG